VNDKQILEKLEDISEGQKILAKYGKFLYIRWLKERLRWLDGILTDRAYIDKDGISRSRPLPWQIIYDHKRWLEEEISRRHNALLKDRVRRLVEQNALDRGLNFGPYGTSQLEMIWGKGHHRRCGIVSSVRLRDSALPIRGVTVESRLVRETLPEALTDMSDSWNWYTLPSHDKIRVESGWVTIEFLSEEIFSRVSRRQAKKLLGNRRGKGGREYKNARQQALERELEREFRTEVRDLALRREIEALSSFEYRSFVDYLGRGMSEVQALARVQAEIARREEKEAEQLRREMLAYASSDDFNEDYFFDDRIGEAAASYEDGGDSYDPPSD
jgi:hypothetical protein